MPSNHKQHQQPSHVEPVVLEFETSNELLAEQPEILVHPLAADLPKLSEAQITALKNDIIVEERVQLRTPILISRNGWILDGQHRARILAEAGHASELARQIAAGKGRWVSLLQQDDDEITTIVTQQLARRNCSAWRVALSLYPLYKQQAKLGTQNVGRNSSGEISGPSPTAAFCKKTAISPTTFKRVGYVLERATEQQIESLRNGRITFHRLYADIQIADGSHKRMTTAVNKPAESKSLKSPPIAAHDDFATETKAISPRGSQLPQESISPSRTSEDIDQHTSVDELSELVEAAKDLNRQICDICEKSNDYSVFEQIFDELPDEAIDFAVTDETDGLVLTAL